MKFTEIKPISWSAFAFSCFIMGQAFIKSNPPEIHQIGSERQLFVDDFLIEASSNIQLSVNEPRKTGEKNLVAEHPWENSGISYSAVLKDGNLYKMWYRCNAFTESEEGERTRHSNWCYATSLDGIRWEKPMLNLIEFQGSSRNNIVIENAFGTVFIDPLEADGNRFKFAGIQRPDRGLVLFSSPDGIRWKLFEEEPVLTQGHFDTQNLAFWDGRLERYVAYVRRWDPQPEEITDRSQPLCCRLVGRTETEDLRSWPEPEVVFGFDEFDPVESDIYTPSVVQYARAPGVYMMFPSVYLHYDPARHDNRRNLGPIDIQFGVSRDGIDWKRPDRNPYLRLGRSGEFDSGGLYMSVGMLIEGDEIWMYYTGYDFLHGGPVENLKNAGVISRLVQRVDGFVSADAAYSGGELTTVPLTFEGGRLQLNIDTSALGEARVELLDAQGRVIPGYGAEECDPINGNFTSHVVTWNGSDDVSSLAGKPVKLRFQMRSAKLFSFRFAL